MQSVTDDLNNEFAGIVAEKYYKAVKEAVKKVDDKLLYLGTRLHGTPKIYGRSSKSCRKIL